MAHVEKFTQGSVNGLSIHIERKTTNHSNLILIQNELI
ncbi:plasmid recombination protein [Vagococcus martis]|nr:plasmid recombination protein [Vagococcus martis]